MAVHAIHVFEIGQFLEARPAPGGPEVDQEQLAALIFAQSFQFVRADSVNFDGLTLDLFELFLAAPSLYNHFVEQPTDGVLATGTGLSASSASMALRASFTVTSGSR